jgi:hypothetical protein
MKNWIIRSPDAGPLELTFLLAMTRAMVCASLVKSPWGGNVETVFTPRTQNFVSAFFPTAFVPRPASRAAIKGFIASTVPTAPKL